MKQFYNNKIKNLMWWWKVKKSDKFTEVVEKSEF